MNAQLVPTELATQAQELVPTAQLTTIVPEMNKHILALQETTVPLDQLQRQLLTISMKLEPTIFQLHVHQVNTLLLLEELVPIAMQATLVMSMLERRQLVPSDTTHLQDISIACFAQLATTVGTDLLSKTQLPVLLEPIQLSEKVTALLVPVLTLAQLPILTSNRTVRPLVVSSMTHLTRIIALFALLETIAQTALPLKSLAQLASFPSQEPTSALTVQLVSNAHQLLFLKETCANLENTPQMSATLLVSIAQLITNAHIQQQLLVQTRCTPMLEMVIANTFFLSMLMILRQHAQMDSTKQEVKRLVLTALLVTTVLQTTRFCQLSVLQEPIKAQLDRLLA